MTIKIGSSATIEGVTDLLNKYFYSTSYQYDGKVVTWSKGIKEDIKVVLKKGRYQITQER